jgi:hypothetical protein
LEINKTLKNSIVEKQHFSESIHSLGDYKIIE